MVKSLVAIGAMVSAVAAQQEIVNGTEAEIGKHLYVTGLRDTELSPARCGASLVAPKVLLTAAHCAETFWAKWASIGSHYSSGDKDGERIEIVKQTRHPKYNPMNNDYDFAVLELKAPSKYTPVPITWEDDAFNAPDVWSWVRGFGRIKSGGASSPVLLEAQVQIWEQAKCKEAYGKRGKEVTESMLCAGGLDKDTCQGDSGGPLTVVKNGQEHLAGITSWGIGCATPGLPGVYSRISKARDFIEPFLPSKPAC